MPQCTDVHTSNFFLKIILGTVIQVLLDRRFGRFYNGSVALGLAIVRLGRNGSIAEPGRTNRKRSKGLNESDSSFPAPCTGVNKRSLNSQGGCNRSECLTGARLGRIGRSNPGNT